MLIEFHNEWGWVDDIFIEDGFPFLRKRAVGLREDDYCIGSNQFEVPKVAR
jgi:hypothetical protein